MNRLQTELLRLFAIEPAVDAGDHGAPFAEAADGFTTRALVLELARPADWSALAVLWHGVQTDLSLPAPAIAVNGVDAFQLWFSVAEPVSVTEGQRFLDGLQRRYLAGVAPARIALRMLPEEVPALREATGNWSAFIARDLAAVFADEPWLDMYPSPEAQADVLSRLRSIKPVDFQAACDQLAPPGAPHAMKREPALAGLLVAAPRSPGVSSAGATASSTETLDPKRFLLGVMADPGADLRWRIEAARALLPYFEKTPHGS
jgi:hypothetical protein